MNTKTVTAQNCSLFEIDAELEEAFDQLQEERERHDQQRKSRALYECDSTRAPQDAW